MRPGATGWRRAALIWGVAGLSVFWRLPASAKPRPVSIDIAGGDASRTLRELGRQSGANILFSPLAVRNVRTQAVRAAASAEDAARAMLVGTALEVVSAADGSVLIRPAAPPPRPPPARIFEPRRPRPAVPAPGRAEAVEPPPPSDLSELVVTATRVSAPINAIPLSITAFTQKSLDQQGFKTAQDIAYATPALQITANTTNGSLVSIRGIFSSQGAATTGVYLDDTPLQRRAGLGSVNGLGIVFPQIFDLQRVEVLRGPQGTLYGASSEGGTVRFILPAPSETTRSFAAKTEVSSTAAGDPSYETGVAIGAPIVQGKLGYRLSLWSRHTGGYIDHVSRFTGRVLAADTNESDVLAGRLAFVWAASPRLRITPSLYYAHDLAADADTWWNPVPAVTRPTAAYDAAGAPVAVGSPAAAYTLPGFTYGPYAQYGPYRTGANACVYADALASPANDQCAVRQPRKSTLTVTSLTADYAFDRIKLKAISSFLEDSNRGAQNMLVNSIATANAGLPFIYNLAYARAEYAYATQRRQWTQEVRLSSDVEDAAVKWVAGAFLLRSTSKSNALLLENSNDFYIALRGVGQAVCCGGAPLFPDDPLLQSYRDQAFTETEAAGFGELTYRLTPRLSATGGLRLTRSKISFDQTTFGPTIGYTVPTRQNGGLTSGFTAETALSPKAGLSYRLGESNLAYLTAAKGFRAGGVNAIPPAGRCQGDLDQLGLDSTPQTFASDSVWSYEGGAKLGSRDGRLRGNVSVFRIDWKTPQTAILLPTCGFSFTINAGRARSEGFDLQAEAYVGRGLTLQGSIAYTHARQLDEVIAPSAVGTVYVTAGDRLITAPWSVHLAAQYDARVWDRPAYLRADFRATSRYASGRRFPAVSYNPDTRSTDGTHLLNLRGGVQLDRWDLAIFVNNLTAAKPRLTLNGGRTGCTTEVCDRFKTYNPVQESITLRPRTLGISAAYQY